MGRSPAAPVTPLRTTSHGCAAASIAASSPSPDMAGANSATCRAKSSGWDPPAVRPTTRKRSGWARTRSSAWVPMEPVEPSTTMSRRSGAVGLPVRLLVLLVSLVSLASKEVTAEVSQDAPPSRRPLPTTGREGPP